MTTSLLEAPFAKPAPTDHPIHDLLRLRWSPRAFSGDDLTAQELQLLFEAARWSPSASNEQPWAFLAATRSQPQAFQQLLDCLTPGNQAWAGKAALLVITAARRQLLAKPQPNRTALYDLGQSVACLTVQATALGIAVHQMAGVDLDKARQACGIPDTHEAVTAIAIGRPGTMDSLPEPIRAKDAVPRTRKPASDFVHGASWGQQAAW